MSNDRRRAARYRLIAEAEVIEVLTNAKLKGQTSDLSIGGCFLDMLNPLPKGAEVEVRIGHAGSTFTARGTVAFVVPNMGMGIALTNLGGSEVVILQEWILQLACED